MSAPSAASSVPTPTLTPTPTPTPTPAVDCSQVKCVALTYDDGPSELTAQLLDTFKAHDAQATFFLLAPAAETYPDVVKRQIAEGHEVGNHTVNHVMLAQQSDDKAASEISDGQARIAKLSGKPVNLLRPPYGDRSKRIDAIAGKYGQAVINWTTSPEDWTYQDAATIEKLTLERVTPNSIILMHDTHTWTVNAAGPILTGLKKQGYHFVTVTQLLQTPKPGVLYPR